MKVPLPLLLPLPLIPSTDDSAHSGDIFALATTPTQIITGSSSPDLKIYSTTDFIQEQVLKSAHPSGCHHIAIARNFQTFVSVGFQGDAKIFTFVDGVWKHAGEIAEAKKAGELWAVALESEGARLKEWPQRVGEAEVTRVEVALYIQRHP